MNKDIRSNLLSLTIGQIANFNLTAVFECTTLNTANHRTLFIAMSASSITGPELMILHKIEESDNADMTDSVNMTDDKFFGHGGLRGTAAKNAFALEPGEDQAVKTLGLFSCKAFIKVYLTPEDFMGGGQMSGCVVAYGTGLVLPTVTADKAQYGV